MKITAINVYQVDLPLVEGRYTWAEGKYVDVFDSTIVEIETDEGLRGLGEVCPLGPFYLPAYGPGARTAIGELAPHLLGLDPTAVAVVNEVMDRALLGHPYAKSPLDIACWDLLGQSCGRPLVELLGGRFGEQVVLYRAISQDTPQAMAASVGQYREQGYTRFQLKVGGEVQADIARIRAVREALDDSEILVADANTGWLMHEAARVVDAVRDLDVYIEQPCRSYDECLTIRRRTARPFVLDENIDGLEALLRAHRDGAMDIVNIKISKVGGLSKARQIRDLCASLGIAMTIEDSWGGDVVTASIAHLAHSAPEAVRFTSTDFNSYVTVSNATGAPQRDQGCMRAGTAAGLGVTLNREATGEPVARYT